MPVYNVEPYLPQCLDSLIAQTHHNLEIILINDGSGDGSGEVCDRYAARDNRFKVIHQLNAGVSAARNAGLDAAAGDWIGFVDSDDWVEPRMYEKLLAAALTNGADIAACGHAGWQSGKITGTRILQPASGLMPAAKALEHAVFYRSSAVWDKLYKKDVVGDLRFDCAHTHSEDKIFVIDALMSRGGDMAYVSESLYFYRKREGSVTASRFLPRVFFSGVQEIIEAKMALVSKKFVRMARAAHAYYACALILKVLHGGSLEHLPMVRKKARANMLPFLFSGAFGFKKKLSAVVALLFPRFAYKIWENRRWADQ